MMFLVNDAGVPSVARIVSIQGVSAQDALAVSAAGDRAPTEAELVSVATLLAHPGSYLRVYAREAEIDRAEKGTRVVVGITVTCPYGIGACWGGPYEALGLLDSVAYVRPVPDPDDSTAELFLKGDVLPPLDTWEKQYAQHVNRTSEMRGVEVTLRGTLERQAGGLILAGRPARAAVALRRLAAHEKVQWSHAIRERKPLEPSEAGAFDTLMAAMLTLRDGREVAVTGPLMRGDDGYELHVRTFEM
jgi:hypothetical protein